jgi:hypothetical protein
VLGREVADHAHDHVRVVMAGGAADLDEPLAALVEVVLDELA